MSLDIKWVESEAGLGQESADVFQYKLIVLAQPIVDLNYRVSWSVVNSEGNVVRRGDEKVTHQVALMRQPTEYAMDKAKASAEKAMMDIISDALEKELL